MRKESYLQAKNLETQREELEQLRSDLMSKIDPYAGPELSISQDEGLNLKKFSIPLSGRPIFQQGREIMLQQIDIRLGEIRVEFEDLQ